MSFQLTIIFIKLDSILTVFIINWTDIPVWCDKCHGWLDRLEQIVINLRENYPICDRHPSEKLLFDNRFLTKYKVTQKYQHSAWTCCLYINTNLGDWAMLFCLMTSHCWLDLMTSHRWLDLMTSHCWLVLTVTHHRILISSYSSDSFRQSLKRMVFFKCIINIQHEHRKHC